MSIYWVLQLMNLTDSHLAQAGKEKLELAMLRFLNSFAFELWHRDPACTIPVLKLMAEFVRNKSQQLPFDVSFPSGILLLRETSKMITMYGNRMLTLGEVSKDQVYTLELKGIPICFSMLKANSLTPEKQQAMRLCFKNLMEAIEQNLLTKNRQNHPDLSASHQEVITLVKNSTDGVNSNNMKRRHLLGLCLYRAASLWSGSWGQTITREKARLILVPSSRGVKKMATVN
ncbi:Exportin-7 [Myotis brandtii]|uniref:Exportin-7 n=1 Tax=Myotis brandtii TaxID=109478 RepID=S7P8H0_MYOBR|nr:Exportin-7 [Myotis brandtii]